mgnify:CR=1 FL=1
MNIVRQRQLTMSSNSFSPFWSKYKKITQLAPAEPSASSYCFVVNLMRFDARVYEALYSRLGSLRAKPRFLAFAESGVRPDTWCQLFLLDTTSRYSAAELRDILSQLIPETNWTETRCQIRAVPSKAIRVQILTEFADDPIKAVPLWKEPLSNTRMVICNFMTFEQAIELCDAITANDLKAKKRDYSRLAQLLYPLYAMFAGYMNDRRVFFYDASTRLWMINNSMEPSVTFLLGLVRQFLDGPFRRFQEDRLDNCHPDDTETRGRIKKTISAIGKFLSDFGASGPQRELIKQLKGVACGHTNGETSKLALKFGQDLDWLPFRNGVDINVYTKETRVRRRHHRQVHCCNIDWNPNPDPEFLECVRQFFLTVASQQDERMMNLLVQAFVIFSGKNHKFIFVNLGQTANSKSTLQGIYEAILGEFAIRAAKSTFCESRATASSHTGFLSQLAFKRLILLDDQLEVKDKVNLSFLKRITTPNNEELVRDANCKEMFKISLTGTVVICLNPDDIPKSLRVCSDPAMTRRFILLLHETRFVSKAKFAELPAEHQTSGCYAVADDGLLEKMKSPHLLEALTYFILHEGGREYQRRCASDGPFTSNPDLLKEYFGQDFDDFEEWWKEVTVAKDPEAQESLSTGAVAERYNRDHPDSPKLGSGVAMSLLRKIHPTPTIDLRTVSGKGRVRCVMNIAFVRAQLPSASSTSGASVPLSPDVASCSSDSPLLVDDDPVDELSEEFAQFAL